MIPLRDLNPSRRTPWVTWSVILICAVVFVFQMVQPPELQVALMHTFALVPMRITQMFAAGLDTTALIAVFTSMFMHGGLLHVVGNLWFLRIFGDNVEDHFGHGRYVTFYLACGLAAAAAQWAVDPLSSVPMVGASGAIAGVLAAYVVLHPHARVVTMVPFIIFFRIVELPAYFLIAVWFALQFFSGFMSLGTHAGGGVAYWAHIGGFVAGLILTFVMRRRPELPSARSDWPGIDPSSREWR